MGGFFHVAARPACHGFNKSVEQEFLLSDIRNRNDKYHQLKLAQMRCIRHNCCIAP